MCYVVFIKTLFLLLNKINQLETISTERLINRCAAKSSKYSTLLLSH